MDRVVYGVKNRSRWFFAGETEELIEAVDTLSVVDQSGVVMITIRVINVHSRNYPIELEKIYKKIIIIRNQNLTEYIWS